MSVAHLKPIVGIHRNDPEWIIALWLAIHGGDPARKSRPEGRTGGQEAIRALSGRLAPSQQKAVIGAFTDVRAGPARVWAGAAQRRPSAAVVRPGHRDLPRRRGVGGLHHALAGVDHGVLAQAVDVS